jgi:hypothetical protein
LDDWIEAIQEQPVANSSTWNEARILACGFDLLARGLIGSNLVVAEDQVQSKQRHHHYQHVDDGAPDGIHQIPPNSQSITKNDTLILNSRLDMTLASASAISDSDGVYHRSKWRLTASFNPRNRRGREVRRRFVCGRRHRTGNKQPVLVRGYPYLFGKAPLSRLLPPHGGTLVRHRAG